MDAKKTSFLEFIDGKKQFVIPVFQRDYCWTVEQCTRLWKDLEEATYSGHFFGTFVNVLNKGDAVLQKWLVIDGQQRLTTLSLLMTALRDYLKDIGWSGIPHPDEIQEEFLVNNFQPQNSDSRFKLILRRVDDKTLRAYIESKDLGDNHSESIREAYECFREKIAETQLNPNDVYKRVSNLQLVLITLDKVDKPQSVFESLNSTGLDLSQSDLVRNFLLMGLEESEQTSLYEIYWKKIEMYFQRYGPYIDLFLRDYVAIKKESSTFIKSPQIYEEFKNYKSSCKLTSKDILEDLLKYARHYAEFMFADSKSCEELHNLKVYGNTHAILLMKLGDLRQSKFIVEDVYLKMLRLIDSYLLRRAVLRLQTRSYWTIFAGITHKIKEDAPFDTFQVAMAQLSDNYKFPTDEVFRTELEEGNLIRLRLCKPILDRLENHGQREPSPTDTYSIEHIMPQNPNLNDSWQKMLGQDWKEIQDVWVHRLGNLTLTGYNQKLSDQPFEKKKTIENGFNESSIRLNKFVREQEQWTEEEIRIRGEKLADRAIDIWPSLQVDTHVIRERFIIELKTKETQRSPQEIEMEPEVRKLFHNVHSQISEFGDVITLTERKSVCLHNPDFFTEIIPRKYSLYVLMHNEANSFEDPEGIVHDANQWKFITNATHRDCNSFLDIGIDWNSEKICAAVQIVKQAFEIADK